MVVQKKTMKQVMQQVSNGHQISMFKMWRIKVMLQNSMCTAIDMLRRSMLNKGFMKWRDIVNGYSIMAESLAQSLAWSLTRVYERWRETAASRFQQQNVMTMAIETMLHGNLSRAFETWRRTERRRKGIPKWFPDFDPYEIVKLPHSDQKQKVTDIADRLDIGVPLAQSLRRKLRMRLRLGLKPGDPEFVLENIIDDLKEGLIQESTTKAKEKLAKQKAGAEAKKKTDQEAVRKAEEERQKSAAAQMKAEPERYCK